MAIQVQTCKMEFMKQVLPRFTRPGGWSDDKKNNNKTEQISSELIVFYAVAIWLVTGQGFQNTKWPAVLYYQ